MSNSILQIIWSCSVQKKNAPKNTKYSRNEIILKIGHHPMVIFHEKSSLSHFGSKIKIPKNMSNSILQIIYSHSVQKTALKNTKYSRNKNHFENRPSCRRYSQCKILTLGQKLKFKKLCQTPFSKSFRVVLCKKTFQKTPNIRKMKPFQISPSGKGYSPCKILTLGQKLKFKKTCQNPF